MPQILKSPISSDHSVYSWMKDSMGTNIHKTEDQRGTTRSLRDFGPSRNVPSSSALVKLSIGGRNAWLYSQRLQTVIPYLTFQGRDGYIKGWIVVYLTPKSLLLCTGAVLKVQPFPFLTGQVGKDLQSPSRNSLLRMVFPCKTWQHLYATGSSLITFQLLGI